MKQFKQGDDVPQFGLLFRKKTIVRMWKQDEPFECESREGILIGKAGDYLCEDDHDGFYPISAEFHSKNYEHAE